MSENTPKRIIDVHYKDYHNLPYWKKAITDTVSTFIRDLDPECFEHKRLRIKITRISSCPDSKFRIELEPAQNVDTSDLAGAVINKLRTLELSYVLNEDRKKLEEEFYRYRLNWENDELERRKTWEAKAFEYYQNLCKKHDEFDSLRKDWEKKESQRRREFEVQITSDGVSRPLWEHKQEAKYAALQKKMNVVALLLFITTVISVHNMFGG